MRLDYLPLMSLALMLVVSAATYTHLPAVMTIHWNLYLQPNGFAKKQFAVLILPAIALLLVAMQMIGRAVSDGVHGPLQFSSAVNFGVPVLLVAHLVMIAIALISATQG